MIFLEHINSILKYKKQLKIIQMESTRLANDTVPETINVRFFWCVSRAFQLNNSAMNVLQMQVNREVKRMYDEQT